MMAADRRRLLLDEMFSPALAAALRDFGHDVVAVAERPDLRALSDDKVFTVACADVRWLVSENVKDFRPILLRAVQEGSATTGVLFTSSRTFARSRKNPGPLLSALQSWRRNGPPEPSVVEDWLTDTDQ